MMATPKDNGLPDALDSLELRRLLRRDLRRQRHHALLRARQLDRALDQRTPSRRAWPTTSAWPRQRRRPRSAGRSTWPCRTGSARRDSLSLSLADKAGNPLQGAVVQARLVRPTHEGLRPGPGPDRTGPGPLQRRVEVPLPGLWEVRLQIARATTCTAIAKGSRSGHDRRHRQRHACALEAPGRHPVGRNRTDTRQCGARRAPMS